MDKLLVIPHAPRLSVRVRSHEIARHLAQRYDVHYLLWCHDAGASSSRPLRRAARLWGELKQAVGAWRPGDLPDGPLHYVTAPALFRPVGRQLGHNRRSIRRLCRRLGVALVLNASAQLFETAGLPGLATVYDLVDDHVSLAGARTKAVVQRVIDHEVRCSDEVVTVSHALIELIRERYGREAHYVPNGAAAAEVQSVGEEQVAALRRELGLEGRYVIGCIGNHGPWSGLELLLEAFELAAARMPDAALLIVGPGTEAARWRHRASRRVVFTGPVPPGDVARYFRLIDLGTLPFEVRPFTDNALPIKVLEYAAAGRLTVATPLKELRTLRLPGVVFSPPEAPAWAEALREARGRSWQGEWDEAYRAFEWSRIAATVAGVLEGARARAAC